MKIKKNTMTDIKLPAIIDKTSSVLEALTNALGVPRDILASDDEIAAAWTNLPRILKKIPKEQRTPELALMCVAVASGLFDSAINYVWNASIIELRGKVRRFGLSVVRQLIENNDFDRKALLDMKDAELLELCLKLNLITEDGYFFLDQCRDIRNNFSAAHPAVGKIDDNEFISFVNRCAKYALGNEQNPVGVDVQAFISAVKGSKFNKEQLDEWVDRLNRTHEAQRELLLGTLHGIFCDPASSEEARINALSLSSKFSASFSPTTKSELIDRHQDYLAKGDIKRHKRSQRFFEKLGLLDLLSESERHTLISYACKKLLSVHQSFDNFHNEPPFAERLDQISSQGAIPDTVKYEFVSTILTCAVGNAYGTSRAADLYYSRMIQRFSPSEIVTMLELPETRTIVGSRIRSHRRCKVAFKNAVALIDPESIPTSVEKAYKKWTK